MIDFNSFYALALQFFSTHIPIAIALGIAIIFSFYKKTDATVKVLAGFFFLMAFYYTMSLFIHSNACEDIKMVNKTDRYLQDSKL